MAEAVSVYDAAIAGGGPAGLATAIALAQRGLRVAVLERQGCCPDKACGEGLMPSALTALRALGVTGGIDPSQSHPFVGLKFIQPDGGCATASLPNGGGLGVRRVVLEAALEVRARELGVELHHHTGVSDFTITPEHVGVFTTKDPVKAKVLIAADGLNSWLRRAAGFNGREGRVRRFGLRQHFQIRPASPFVEVHFGDGIEAYVTPMGPELVGVALLWEPDFLDERASFDNLILHFPALVEQLNGAKPASRVRGAGPMYRLAKARVGDRFLLIGDAAGYIDAITGEGLSIAFNCALAVGRILPDAIAHGASRQTLLAYDREFLRHFRRYAALTHLMLVVTRRPWLRHQIVRMLGRNQWAFELMLLLALGTRNTSRFGR